MESSLLPHALSGITSHVACEVLSNGLTVLVKENHAAPVAAVLVSVKAGYFQEADAVNGIAHVIEHMLFKGTPRRSEDEQIAREVRELGGYINAGTYYEETTYYLTVPSQHVEPAMDILADACRHSLFDADELAKEIEVIVQESLQKRDNPNAMLLESLYAQAYDLHRLRRWRIGHPETLRAFRREDLLQFVADNYRPENIVLTVVGDVATDQILMMARNLWSDLPRGENSRALSPPEPERNDFRYQRLKEDTRQHLLLFSIPVPDTLHPDAAPLMVLSGILSDGRSARLYRRLKEELKLANNAWASYESFEQMGIFTLGAESSGDDPLPVEQALWEEIRRVQQEPIELADLERLKTRIETRRLFAQEEVMGLARALSSYQQLGDYHLADTLLERLRAVTAADVQRVATHYLRIEGASLLEYLPLTSTAPDPLSAQALQERLAEAQNVPTDSQASVPTQTAHSELPDTEFDKKELTQAETITSNPALAEAVPSDSEAQEFPLSGGGKLLFKARRDLPIIAINVLFHGSKKRETRATAGITNLMLKSSMKGTLATADLPALSAHEIANRIEGLGTGIGLSLAMEYFGYGIKVKKDVLPEAFDLFAAVINHPALAADEVDKEKQALYADIKRQQDNNYSLAYDLYAAACYGDEHPYGLPANGIEASVAAMTATHLREWHMAQVTPENMIVSIVGDIDAQEAIAYASRLLAPASLNTAPFASSGSVADAISDLVSGSIALPTPSIWPQERSLQKQKQQTATMMGFGGADLFNSDRYALDVLNEITSGMGGRLFRAVRGENALAYQVTSFHRSRLDVGNFLTYTSTAPENEIRARDLILEAIRQLQNELVSAEELRMAKASILGEHVINMQTFGTQAGELAVLGIYGLPLDEAERYLQHIQTVTAEQIRDAARKYLDTERFWVGVVRGGHSES